MAIDTPAVVGSIAVRGNPYPVYGSQARATEYFVPHIDGEGFLDAEFLEQQKALITAQRLIDRQIYLGTKAVITQSTQFPRNDDTTVPIGIEIAQYEMALILLDDPTFFNATSTGSNDRRLKAGSVEIEFFSQTLRSTSIGGAAKFPPQILDLLKPYLAASASISAPFVGGLANESNVIPRVGNDISEGL